MGIEDEIQQLLRDHGAVLIRQRKHCIWQFPDGRIFVHAKTPSDRHAANQILRRLRAVLGIERECHKNPDRRPKPGVDRRPGVISEPVRIRRDWRTQLSQAMGWVELSRWRHRRNDGRPQT